MFGMNRGGRPEMMQAVLTVKEKIYLTPHYIRIVLTGDVGAFRNARPGDNNKLLIPENGSRVELPDFGQRGGRNGGNRALMRTYTLRYLDLSNNLMTIDFVAHGENGPASKWAMLAKAGDELGVLMKKKEKSLFQPAASYLIAGDHTALPVIGVILETLPPTSKGMAIIEVHSETDIQELTKPIGMDIVWKTNSLPGETSSLPGLLSTFDFSQDDWFVFVAAESQAVNEAQAILRNSENLSRNQWQAYSYWKYGQSEESSAGARREMMNR